MRRNNDITVIQYNHDVNDDRINKKLKNKKSEFFNFNILGSEKPIFSPFILEIQKWIEVIETDLSSTTDITKVLKFCSRDTGLYLQTWDDQSIGSLIWHGNEQLATVSVSNEHDVYPYQRMFDDDLSSFWHSQITSDNQELGKITIIFKV